MRAHHARWLTAWLAVSAAAACASTGTVDDARLAQQRLVDALDRGQAADSAWVAALFSSRGDANASSIAALRQRMERAIAAAPNDRVVAVVALRLCDVGDACDPVRAGDRLDKIDPANAVGRLPRLELAAAARDEGATDAVLNRLADAAYWNVYYTEASTRATRAVLQAVAGMEPAHARHYGDPKAAYVSAVGQIAALVPPLSSISRACENVKHVAPRRVTCLRIARAMQASDTLLLEGVGTSLALRLTDAGSPEHLIATDARRRFEWQLEAVARMSRLSMPADYPDLASRMPREQDVVAALMAQRGISRDPPVGWKPALGSSPVAASAGGYDGVPPSSSTRAFDRITMGTFSGWISQCCIRVEADGQALLWHSRSLGPPDAGACRISVSDDDRRQLERLTAAARPWTDRRFSGHCVDDTYVRFVVEHERARWQVSFPGIADCRSEPVPEWLDQTYALLERLWREGRAHCPPGDPVPRRDASAP